MHGEEGVSLVEFAFSFMILSTMIFGIMELALCLYTYNFVDETAREATRYASVRGSFCTGFSDCGITQTQIATYIKNLGYPGVNPKSLSVTASWPKGNSPGNSVIVTVAYQFPLAVPFVSKKTWTLSSTSQMVISQ
jgi:Flp pilus assembly protein TadG